MGTLAELLPGHAEPKLSADAVLDRFVTWVSSTGLSLYSHQEEAILELLGGRHVVLATPTGSGKSLVALAFHFQAMAEGKRSIYTCPIKALVNEKFFALCDAFGAANVGMMTGDAAINRDAPILCCTAEILSNLALRQQHIIAEAVVMDEFHYYGDKDRGVAWQVPLISMPETQFLLMSATLGELTTISESLTDITKREVAEVRSAQRPVPLEFTYSEKPLHEMIQELLRASRAPIYLVNFSQRSAAEQAQNLLSIDVCTKEEKEALKASLVGVRFDTPFGKDLKRLLLHGIGIHHAGLLPRYRRLVERLAQQGRLKVVSGTDTLGVGVNVPIRTVLFTQLCKFDGEKTSVLSVRDFQQIAGRAGRKGFDEVGFVVAQAPAHVIENIKLQQKRAEGKRNVTLQKAPTKGYAHWDAATFERLRTSLPEKLESRFSITHGLVVSLLQAFEGASSSGYRRLVELVQLSHTSEGTRLRLLKHARTLLQSLTGAGLVIHEKRTPTALPQLRVAQGLQNNFSLHHTLSLYLVETLALLDAQKETWPLDVLSLVEAILENPDPVLWAQVDAAKDAKVRELKAQGVEYEQRMEELEKVTYPKPNEEFVYNSFDAFALKHPWVQHNNVRPKSIARDLFERCMTFNEYIREYGLQRSEGVVLRYLSDVYKTLIQNVPESVRSEPVDDIAAYVLTTLKQTDSSLLEEWEALKENRALGTVRRPGEETPAPQRDLARDLKTLTARVRAEMHQVVKLLAKKDYEELAVAQPHWTTGDLESALAALWAEQATIDTTPKARQPKWTTLEPEGPRRWVVRHSLLDAEGEPGWFLEGEVDLTNRNDVDGSLVRLRQVRR